MRAGRIKGAHYTKGGLAVLVCALSVLCGVDEPGARAAQPEADARKTEAELQAVKFEIERVTRQVSEEAVAKDRLSKELKNAELSVGKAREGLDGVRRSRAEQASKRSSLAAQKKAREADLAQNRGALAGQLRAAYQIGREEPLKLLLNQKDPERAGRMFVYYSYFGRARAYQIL